MRERQFVRINLTFERLAKGFSHSQDPKRKLPGTAMHVVAQSIDLFSSTVTLVAV